MPITIRLVPVELAAPAVAWVALAAVCGTGSAAHISQLQGRLREVVGRGLLDHPALAKAARQPVAVGRPPARHLPPGPELRRQGAAPDLHAMVQTPDADMRVLLDECLWVARDPNDAGQMAPERKYGRGPRRDRQASRKPKPVCKA